MEPAKIARFNGPLRLKGDHNRASENINKTRKIGEKNYATRKR